MSEKIEFQSKWIYRAIEISNCKYKNENIFGVYLGKMVIGNITVK